MCIYVGSYDIYFQAMKIHASEATKTYLQGYNYTLQEKGTVTVMVSSEHSLDFLTTKRAFFYNVFCYNIVRRVSYSRHYP